MKMNLKMYPVSDGGGVGVSPALFSASGLVWRFFRGGVSGRKKVRTDPDALTHYLKITPWFGAVVAICFLAGAACSQQSAPTASSTGPSSNLTPTGPLTRLTQRSGSKMRLEGHALTGDWQSESGLIIGFLEVGPNFPLEPGQAVTPGKVEARGEAAVAIRTLKSKKKDGTYYSDGMDDKMYNMLMETNHPKIVFKLTELVLKEAPQDKTAPYVFDAKGDLEVAGVTNAIAFPAKVLPQGEKEG